MCNVGKLSYFATRILRNNGFDAISLKGGTLIHKSMYEKNIESVQETIPATPVLSNQTMDVAPIAVVAEPVEPVVQEKPIQAPIMDAVEELPASPIPQHAKVRDVVEVDACGIACPGPILKLKSSVEELDKDQVLEITATDPGFKKDVKVFCDSQGLNLVSLDKQKGIIKAIISR